MSKRKKPEPKPTPPAPDIASDHSATLARDGLPIVIETKQPSFVAVLLGVACPICGTARASDVCPVDGHHFEVTK